MSQLFGVIGDPVAQSLSPLIHKGWMRDHAIDADYLALQVAAGGLDDALETLMRKGFKGLNITMPHKLRALELAAGLTDSARTIGAVNTLWRGAGAKWQGDNTDAPGFLGALARLIDVPLAGQSVLVIGAGGAARAIVYALDSAGAQIILANRTLEKAQSLLAAYAGKRHRATSLEEGLAQCQSVDFVVNTASLGHAGQSLDLPPGAGKLFYDISYGPAAALILAPARAKGWRAADGLSMLVYQGALAFERWHGIMPDVDKGLARCRAVLEML